MHDQVSVSLLSVLMPTVYSFISKNKKMFVFTINYDTASQGVDFHIGLNVRPGDYQISARLEGYTFSPKFRFMRELLQWMY
jgi:hypothetical protein